MEKARCGDANPGGGIKFLFKGGCDKELETEDAYRCVGCGGYFHRDCIFNHFESEAGHDYSRFALRQIAEIIEKARKRSGGGRPIAIIKRIQSEVKKGLERKPVGKSFGFPFSKK